jgi:hypothetical protein
MQKWQTLQDPPRPSCRRTTARRSSRRATPTTWGGLDLGGSRLPRRFQSDPALTCSRTRSAATCWRRSSRPWQAPGWFVTPKAQVHAPLRLRRAAGQRRAPRRRRDGADLQPGQRPGLRARHQLLRPRLPADAGAARLLRLHAVPRPEQLPNYDSALQRLQLRHHLHRERLRRQRPHRRQQPADAGRHHPPARPDTGAERPASAWRSGCASRTSWSRCPAARR